MIWDFIQVFKKVREQQLFHADDGIDKFNRSVTVIFLIISAILIGARNLIGPAIVCMDNSVRQVPIKLEYVESVCWAKGSYTLFDQLDATSDRIKINYFQWLLFILLSIALSYYIPYLIWKILLRSSFGSVNQLPIDISGIIDLLNKSKIYKLKEFNATVKEVVDYLNTCFIYNSFEYKHALENGFILDHDFDINGRLNLIKLNDNYHKMTRKGKGYRSKCCSSATSICNGSSLMKKYLLVKLIYLLNSIAVFWYLHYFLNTDLDFGLNYFNRLFIKQDLSSADLWHSKQFPRIVYCEIETRDVKNSQIIPFPCSLPINIYNEKIFVFFWFWFLLVAILNTISLLKWFIIIARRNKIIRKYLNLNTALIDGSNSGSNKNVLTNNNSSFSRYEANESRLINLFIRNYLQLDGFLVLLLVKANLNDIYFKRLIDRLWKIYSISNLDDQDLMNSSPPYITSTANIEKKKLNTTSPNVVPEQPSGCKNVAGRKFMFDSNDNSSESKIKLVNENDEICNEESDFFNNETQQQRVRTQPQLQHQISGKNLGNSYVGFRKEDLV